MVSVYWSLVETLMHLSFVWVPLSENLTLVNWRILDKVRLRQFIYQRLVLPTCWQNGRFISVIKRNRFACLFLRLIRGFKLGCLFLRNLWYLTEAHRGVNSGFHWWRSPWNAHWVREAFLNRSSKSGSYLFLTNNDWVIGKDLWLLYSCSEWPIVHLERKLKTLFKRFKNILGEFVIRVYNRFEIFISVKLTGDFLFKLRGVEQCLSLDSLVGLKEVLGVQLLGWGYKKWWFPVEAIH